MDYLEDEYYGDPMDKLSIADLKDKRSDLLEELENLYCKRNCAKSSLKLKIEMSIQLDKIFLDIMELQNTVNFIKEYPESANLDELINVKKSAIDILRKKYKLFLENGRKEGIEPR